MNINNFINKIGYTNWEQILNTYDPHKAFEMFLYFFLDNFQQCFPVKKVKVNNKYNRSPYITTGLKTSIKEKHRLEKLAVKWPLSYKSRYKTYRNNLVSILRTAKNKDHLDELKSN